MSKYYIESNGIWKGKHQLSWAELCDELKQLEKENEQLKSVLFNTVEKLEMKINPDEDTLYAVTLAVDGAMYLKIKEIIHDKSFN